MGDGPPPRQKPPYAPAKGLLGGVTLGPGINGVRGDLRDFPPKAGEPRNGLAVAIFRGPAISALDVKPCCIADTIADAQINEEVPPAVIR